MKEVLRLVRELGYSLRQASRPARLCSTPVRNYLARAEAAGVRYEDIASKSGTEIEALLFAQPEPLPSRPQPDWAAVATELRKPALSERAARPVPCRSGACWAATDSNRWFWRIFKPMLTIISSSSRLHLAQPPCG